VCVHVLYTVYDLCVWRHLAAHFMRIVFKASLERRGCHEFGEYGVALALEASLSPDLDAHDATRRVRKKGGS
jgi:hypothetical protein